LTSLWRVAVVPEKTAILGFPDRISVTTFGKLCLVAIGVASTDPTAEPELRMTVGYNL